VASYKGAHGEPKDLRARLDRRRRGRAEGPAAVDAPVTIRNGGLEETGAARDFARSEVEERVRCVFRIGRDNGIL
jgi:hypothetical protein